MDAAMRAAIRAEIDSQLRGFGSFYTAAGNPVATGSVALTLDAYDRDSVHEVGVLNQRYPRGNPKRYGAVMDGVTDDTTAATNWLNSGAGVWPLTLPVGQLRTTAPLVAPVYTFIQGVRQNLSEIVGDHVGDILQSTNPQNAVNEANLTLIDVGLRTTKIATSVGSCLVQRAGTYVHLIRCALSYAKWPLLLDQSENVSVQDSLLVASGATQFLAWLVNGADSVVGTLPGFTNVINFTRTTFRAVAGTATCLSDDGGGTLNLFGNYLAGAQTQLRIAGRGGGKIIGNNFEFPPTRHMVFAKTTSILGTAVTPPTNLDVQANIFNGGCDYHLELVAAHRCSFQRNGHGPATIRPVLLSGEDISGNEFSFNIQTVRGVSRSAKIYFFANNQAQIDRQDTAKQWAHGYVAAALAAGARTVIPIHMGTSLTNDELVTGAKLWCINDDGTNGEEVTITAVPGGGGAATFDAVFLSAKAANWAYYRRA